MIDFDLKSIFSLEKLEGFFVKKKTSSVGIDIGNDSIKIVELEKKKDGVICLKNYALAKIKNSDSFRGNIHYQISKEVLKKILEELKWNIDSANISIPTFSSLITAIDFSGVSEEEINQIVQIDASKYIPIPLDEVIYGWKIIEKESFPKAVAVEESPSGAKKVEKEDRKKINDVKVVIAAVIKEVSQKYEEILSYNQIGVDTLEVDAFSLARSLGEAGKSFLIVDLGESSTILIATLGKEAVFVKNIDFGGKKITQLLANFLKVDFSRAEKLKFEQGLNVSSTEVKEGILTLFSQIKEEVNLMIGSFNKDLPLSQIEKIVLVGGGAKLIGVKEYFEKEISLAVEIKNPFDKISLDGKIKKSCGSAASHFSTAIGLALLGLE